MPMVFPDGKSLLGHVLGGSADAQAEAVWAYLSLGMNLPLPAGLEPPKGLVLTVKDRPILLRTFMPDASPQSVAVGYPDGVSVTFDAATCRLAYAWSGNFLDASPAWDGRGGNPARPLGSRFWTAPPGCPWATTDSKSTPDFVTRAADPAHGAPLPEGQFYDGPRLLHFAGYTVDASGTPTFRYRLDVGDNRTIEVRERPGPLRSPAGVGVVRQFTLTLPGEQTAWMWAGGAVAEPRLYEARDLHAPLSLDLRTGLADFPAADRILALPQDQERMVILKLAEAPDGTRWHLCRQGSSWQALLSLPATSQARQTSLSLQVWVPYRNDPELLKELLSQK
jgi:hypothetical protein